MAIIFVDMAGWESDLSDECGPFGNGQCDGIIDAEWSDCECLCHRAGNLPRTVRGVQRLHERAWAVIQPVRTVQARYVDRREP